MTVAHTGVHQAFQIALAAQEAGLLDVFYGSIFDAPGKWGRRLRPLVGAGTLINRRCGGLDPARMAEIPLPFLFNRLAKLFYSRTKLKSSFDSRVARRLQKSSSRLFVGVEGCACDSFRVAGERGIKKILDCPQVHPQMLNRLLAEAADDLSVPAPEPFDDPKMAERKSDEYQMADRILVISKIHRQSFVEAGIAENRLVEIPLWVDSELWFPDASARKPKSDSPLTALFVGSIGFRKGIPYLVRAVEECGNRVKLMMVGADSGETNQFIRQSRADIRFLGTRSKSELRHIYSQADVLVLPSLVDTFGFVAMEAMACGLPVIITENCGVPVPDLSWRVPVMNSHKIAERLMAYANDRELCRVHGKQAAEFARQFMPGRYRRQIAALLKEMLTARA